MNPDRDSPPPEQSLDRQVPLDTTGPFRPNVDGSSDRIGPYKVLQQIGEGGFGIVYMAEQDQPVHRRVALKIIKPGMDSSQVIARFEAERQALALMDHQNIAKVFDAGTTDRGLPFFVMELVHGIPMTRFCDENHLSVRERLELFVPVCKAVQHAHQKGIIHRDLKPSNVLVCLYDGLPVPKIIDFGVAKAIDQKLTERTMFTQYGQIIGTFEYMSPEQAEMSQLGVDTRSDIYSLGVMLYELLTGTTPLERQRLRQAGLSEVLHMVKEEEPPRPSTRLSSTQQVGKIAQARRTEPGKLAQLLRGELDWIVMKCLEKDRARRYETANSLAREIERYLHDEPVEACPPSASYRLRKLMRKHRTALNLLAFVLAVLVVGAGVSVWLAVRATLAERQALAERDRADREKNRAETGFRMARETVDRFFTQVAESPHLRARGMEKYRRELLQTSKEFYERLIGEQPDAPSARHGLGMAHYRLAAIHEALGEFAAARTALDRALIVLGELAREDPDVPEYPESLAECHYLLYEQSLRAGRPQAAEQALEHSRIIFAKLVQDYPESEVYRASLAAVTRTLGAVHVNGEKVETGKAELEQAVSIWMRLAQESPNPARHLLGLAQAQNALGFAYATTGRSADAESALQDAESSYREFLRTDPGSLQARVGLGTTFMQLGRLYHNNLRLADKAEATDQKGLEVFEKLAQEPPDVLLYADRVGRMYGNLALDALTAGRVKIALARYEKAIEILDGLARKGYGHARADLYDAQINRANSLVALGEYGRAVVSAEKLAARNDLNHQNLYNLGCVFSLSSAAAGNDTKLSTVECQRLKAQYTDRALELLSQALAKGYSNLAEFKTDKDLDPLRPREDFQKLLQELEQKSKKR